MAAALLRRGQDVLSVSERTGVPVPLLELLLEEHQPPPRRSPPRPGGPPVTLRMAVTVLVVDFLAFCSLTVCVTAFLERQPDIGVVSGFSALILIVAAWWLIRRHRLPSGRSRRTPS